MGDHLRFVLTESAGHLSSVPVPSGRTFAAAARVQRIFEFAFQSTVSSLRLHQDGNLCVDGPIEWMSPPLDAPGLLRFHETYYGCKTLSGTITVEAVEDLKTQCEDLEEGVAMNSVSASDAAPRAARRRKKRAKKKEKARAAKASTSNEAGGNDGSDVEESKKDRRVKKEAAVQRSPSLDGTSAGRVASRSLSSNTSAETHLLLNQVAAAQLQHFGDSPRIATCETGSGSCSSSNGENQKFTDVAGVDRHVYVAHAARQSSKQLAEKNAAMEHNVKVRRFLEQRTPSVPKSASNESDLAVGNGSARSVGQTAPRSYQLEADTTEVKSKAFSTTFITVANDITATPGSCSCVHPGSDSCDKCSADGRIAWQRQRQREKAKVAAMHQRALDARVQSYTQPQKHTATQQSRSILSTKPEVPVVVVQQGKFEPPSVRLQEGEHAIFMVDSSVVGCVRLAVPHLSLESPTLMPGESWTMRLPLGAVPPPSMASQSPLTSTQLAPALLDSGPVGSALTVDRSTFSSEESFESRGNVVDQVFLGTCELTVVHFHCNYPTPFPTATEQPPVQSANEQYKVTTRDVDDDDSFDPSDESVHGAHEGSMNQSSLISERISDVPGSKANILPGGGEYYSSESSSFYDSDDLLSDDNDGPPLAAASGITLPSSTLRPDPPGARRSVSWALASPSPLPPSSPLVGSFGTLGASTTPSSGNYRIRGQIQGQGESNESAGDAVVLSPVRASEVAQAAAAANFYQPSWKDQEVDLSKNRRIPQLPFLSRTSSVRLDIEASDGVSMGVPDGSIANKSSGQVSSNLTRSSTEAVKNRRRRNRSQIHSSHGRDCAHSSASSSSFSSSSGENDNEFHGRLVYGNSVGPMLPSALDVSPLTSPDDTPRHSPAPSPSRSSAHFIRTGDNVVRGSGAKSRSSNSSSNDGASSSSHRNNLTPSSLPQPARPMHPILKTLANAEPTIAAKEPTEMVATASTNSMYESDYDAAPLRSLRRRRKDLRNGSKRTVQAYVDSADEVDSDDYSSMGVSLSSSSSTANTPSAATPVGRTAASFEDVEAKDASAETTAGEGVAASIAMLPSVDVPSKSYEPPSQLLDSPPLPSQLLGSFWSPTDLQLKNSSNSVDNSVSTTPSSHAEFVPETAAELGTRVMTDFAAEALAIAQAEACEAMVAADTAEEAPWTTVSSKPRKQRRNRARDSPVQSSNAPAASQDVARSESAAAAAVLAPSRRSPDAAPAKSMPSPPGPQPRAEIIRASLPHATLAEIPAVAATAPLEDRLEPTTKKKKRKKKRAKGVMHVPKEKISGTTSGQHRSCNDDDDAGATTISNLNLEDATSEAAPSLTQQIGSNLEAPSTTIELDKSNSNDESDDQEGFVIHFGDDSSEIEITNGETGVSTDEQSAPLAHPTTDADINAETFSDGGSTECANSRRVLLNMLHGTTPKKTSNSSEGKAVGTSGASDDVSADLSASRASASNRAEVAISNDLPEKNGGSNGFDGDASTPSPASESEEKDPWVKDQSVEEEEGVEEERRFDPQDGGGPFTRAEFEAFYGHALVWDVATPFRLPWFSSPPMNPTSTATQLDSDKPSLEAHEKLDASRQLRLDKTKPPLPEDVEDSCLESTELHSASIEPADSLAPADLDKAITAGPAAAAAATTAPTGSTLESARPPHQELAALEADTFDFFAARYAAVVALVKESGGSSSARDVYPGGKRVPVGTVGHCSGLSPLAPPFPPPLATAYSPTSVDSQKSTKPRQRHHKPQPPFQEMRKPKLGLKSSRSRKSY